MQTTRYSKKLEDLKMLAKKSTFDRLLHECVVNIKKIGNIHVLGKPTTVECGLTFELICAIFLEHVYPGCVVYHISELPAEIQQVTGLTTKDIGIDLIMVHANMLYPVQCKLRSLTRNPIVKRMCAVLLARELKTFFAACKNPVFSQPIVCTSGTSVSGNLECIVYTRNHFLKVFTTGG